MTDTDNTYNNIEELLPRFCEGMTTAAEVGWWKNG